MQWHLNRRFPEALAAEHAMDEAALARAAEQRKSALIAARAFFEEWSELARTVIKRRDYLIRLGLAQRISRVEPERWVRW
jgi:hypothetical protein